jgi:hypothetical protein
MALRSTVLDGENKRRGFVMGTGITGPTRLWYLTARVALLG